MAFSITALDFFQVSPPPGSSPSHAIIPLTFFDLRWTQTKPVEILFFYPFTNYSTSRCMDFISSLKSSLSLTLKYFYPSAGKLVCKTDGTDNEFVIVYKEGDSVPFYVSECSNGQFEELASSLPRSASLLLPFAPTLQKSDDSRPLLAVQVTLFPDEGIVLGISAHHALFDGPSASHFMHSWAATCLSRSLDSFINPIFDRTLISDPFDLYTKITRTFLKSSVPSLPSDAPSTNGNVLASFTLSKGNIERLKQVISSKAGKMNKSFRCSTTVVAFAFVWICYVKTREAESDNKRLGICFYADFRARAQPPVPTTYFGNCITPCMVQVDRVAFFSDDNLVLVAEAIGKSIEELSCGAKLADDMTRIFEFGKNMPVFTFTGSPRLKFYEMDFGLGKPRKFDIVSIARTGGISVAESREDEGGIEVAIALTKNEMDCFRMYFTNGLKLE